MYFMHSQQGYYHQLKLRQKPCVKKKIYTNPKLK
uniref:Uncharacterized protein n=1 Tax=Anguilla anguilla TaxID=7936 RepID=A0A0E9R3Q0_ANGAN